MGHATRDGFTLIELLVVVTIIVILIAILVPGVEKAAAVAQRAKCMSNLKAWGYAAQLYLQDNRRTYPGNGRGLWTWLGKRGNGAATYGNNVPSFRPINHYIGLASLADDIEIPLAQCPVDRGGAGVTTTLYDYTGSSYVGNIHASSVTRFGEPYVGVTHAQAGLVVSPSRTVGITAQGSLLAALYSESEFKSGNFQQRTYHSRENEYPLGFVDGHVDFMKVELQAYITGAYTFHIER